MWLTSTDQRLSGSRLRTAPLRSSKRCWKPEPTQTRRTFGGDTPLHMASINGFVEPATLLLQYGADPTIRNNRGLTAQDVANEKWPLIEAAKELLAKHAR